VATNLQNLLEEINIAATVIGVSDDIQPVYEMLSVDAEGVYLLPLQHLSGSQYQQIVDELTELKLPSFSYTGAEPVKQGILAGLKKEAVSRVSRRVALNVQRILLGEKPEEIPVGISLNKQLVINDATARAIGVSPPWAVVTEAEMIREERQIERQLSLFTAVQEAVKSNLDLAAQAHFVDAGKQNINQARAQLLPSVDLSASYRMIDEQRAAASVGQQAERTLSGSVTATQLIYSEPAWANLSIQKNLQKSRDSELEQLKLDIIQSAATTYLNVLRAKTVERIQQENLKLTRQNLDFARVREAVGSAGPAEVYRWESEIASNRRAVIEANSLRNVAEIQLNRLLHRPAEESFSTREIDLKDPALITSYRELFKFIEDRRT
ncbi:MAG: TolC family protein, partial [Phycisphaerae bacterium]|nr:TolC family protein [Phycisphaerae bacterium]